MRQISLNSTFVVFMGIFHCSWSSNYGTNENYLTKGYKGSTLTKCQNMDELKSYRCYTHLPLQYTYYGTGHIIYKGYMFYNQEDTNYIVIHNLETQQATRVKAPDDAACCNNNLDANLYNVKHSGYFDFEVDENGLWLIYKKISNYSSPMIDNNDEETNESSLDYNYQTNYDYGIQDVYVIAKLDETDLTQLKVEKKWNLNVNFDDTNGNNIANMFIACGQLYALKNTHQNPAQIEKLCNMNTDDASCTANDDTFIKIRSNSIYNVSISSRQITSINYDPENRLLHMVDGGSFVYYRVEI
jgi:hypothetical protein